MNRTATKLLTINDLANMKRNGEKISCLTAYDASFSALIDSVGIDILLVGDSLGMTIQGHGTTLPVTLDDMVYHTRCVNKGRQRAFLIADLPFMSYPTPIAAAESAARLMKEGGAQMVKLEGVKPDTVRFLTDQGIPVCGHLGLLPQHINRLGGYTVQGKSSADADNIIVAAHQLQDAGALLLVLECVPSGLAKTVSTQLPIPVIGIGAGVDCDGQVLVLHDMLNIGVNRLPRFAKDFLQETGDIAAALTAYHLAVKHAQFPTLDHSYPN